MSVKSGVLALLIEAPKYGYQLKSEFEAATRGQWVVNIGQIYTTLSRLERDGLVAAGEVDDQDRRSYELTPVGRLSVDEWFETPCDLQSQARDEVATKVLLALAAEDIDPMVVIRSQRSATLQELQTLTKQKIKIDEFGARLAIDRQIMGNEAQLRWLDLAEQQIELHTNEGSK